MFNFIKLQYKMGKISSAQVLAFVPQWLTEDEAIAIIGRGIVE